MFPLILALPSLHRDAMGKANKGMCPGAQPVTDRQNHVLQTGLGTDLTRQGAYRPLGRVFLATEYPDQHQPRLTQWRVYY